MNLIESNSLEIFKQNYYIKHDIGYVSNNAYLSIIATNKCQMRCPYCINSETDQSLDLPINLAVQNIRKLVYKYGVKEAIILGGEPLMLNGILKLINELRDWSGLKMLRLTTNGIKLKNNELFIKSLVNKYTGIQGLNISFHNENFIKFNELEYIYNTIKNFNSNIKIRLNVNIWRGNLDNVNLLISFLEKISFYCDEIRVSNIIPKDLFSVNPINKNNSLVLSNNKYENIFNGLIKYYQDRFSIFKNENTLGFVKYIIIPTPKPIIINWNIDSKVSEQICENDINNRKINTFKCLVSGNISLSWNENNILNI